MPRRKRTLDESGRRAKVSRVEHNEETLVISDSDQEVLCLQYVCVCVLVVVWGKQRLRFKKY